MTGADRTGQQLVSETMQPDLRITLPDDWHVHLRDDEMLEAVAGHTARRFGRAMIMPNLDPPITTVAQANDYRARVLDAAAAASGDTRPFDPKMVLYLTADLSIDDLIRGHQAGSVLAVKYYPAGATTNSASGGTSIISFKPVLEAMAEHGIPLLVHAEATSAELDIFDREAAFLETEMQPVCEELPELSVTVEHLSTAAGVALVRSYANTSGSITPHHLSCDRSDLLANGMRPHLYCKPVINSRTDRDALRAAAVSGDKRFFLGTDSAPHPLATKEAEVVRAGIFNAPYALEVVAEVFYQEGALGDLERFVSINGAVRYGFEPSDKLIRLRRRSEEEVAKDPPADLVTSEGVRVRMFGVAEANLWTIA